MIGGQARHSWLDGGGGGASPGYHWPLPEPSDFCRRVERRAWPRVLFPPVAPGDKLWWADQLSEKMGTCNKADGSGSVVLRNSTTLVMHMKVYDESIQLGRQWARGVVPRGPAAAVGAGMGVREGLQSCHHERPAAAVGQGSKGWVGLRSSPPGTPFPGLHRGVE